MTHFSHELHDRRTIEVREEDLAVERLFARRAVEWLRDAIGLGLLDEGEAGPDAPEAPVPLP